MVKSCNLSFVPTICGVFFFAVLVDTMYVSKPIFFLKKMVVCIMMMQRPGSFPF